MGWEAEWRDLLFRAATAILTLTWASMYLREWKWSSSRHYALREIGIVEIESGTATDPKKHTKGVPTRVFLNPG
jgi:hypothetical protein